MKIYEFEFNCDRDTAIEEVLHDTKKPPVFFENDSLYGKKIGSFVRLHYGISYRNSFRPIFTLCFKEIEPGKTKAKGFFRWNWFTTLFSIVWVLGVLSVFFNMGNAPWYVFLFPLFFLLFFAGMVVFCTYLERNNRKAIIEHVKMHQRIINNEADI